MELTTTATGTLTMKTVIVTHAKMTANHARQTKNAAVTARAGDAIPLKEHVTPVTAT